MTAEQTERLHTEATARVTWGDFPEDVTEYLVAQGMDAQEAHTLVKRLVAERSAEVRRRSALKLAGGLAMCILGFAGVYFILKGGYRSSFWSRIWGGSFLLTGFYGIIAVWRSLMGLLVPASEVLTDVEDNGDGPDSLPDIPV